MLSVIDLQTTQFWIGTHVTPTSSLELHFQINYKHSSTATNMYLHVAQDKGSVIPEVHSQVLHLH